MADRYLPSQSRARLIRGVAKPGNAAAPPTYSRFAPSGTAGRNLETQARFGAERKKLAVYALAIILASALTRPFLLGAALLCVLLVAGREAPALLRRAVLATVYFSAMVSLAYVIQIFWLTGDVPWRWLLTVNLRVLLMALITFLFIQRANLFAALSFSRRLSFMLALAVSQSIGLRRTLDDFQFAMRSRGVPRGALRDRYRATARAAGWLLDRALANAHESAQALRSRGLLR